MVDVRPTGSGVIGDGTLPLLVTFKEKIRPCCINQSVLPQATVTFQSGTPKFVGTTVFIPIKAIVRIEQQIGGKVVTTLHNESFVTSFADQTALPTTVTLTTEGEVGGPTDFICCKANRYTLNVLLNIVIA